MLEAAGHEVFAYDDAAVCPVIDAIAGAELHALAGHGGVDANVGPPMAGGTVSAFANYRHLAGVLAARHDGYAIGALGQAVMRIFRAVAHLPSVNADLAVNGCGPMPDSQ